MSLTGHAGDVPGHAGDVPGHVGDVPGHMQAKSLDMEVSSDAAHVPVMTMALMRGLVISSAALV